MYTNMGFVLQHSDNCTKNNATYIDNYCEELL
jgi:hypothetical protein